MKKKINPKMLERMLVLAARDGVADLATELSLDGYGEADVSKALAKLPLVPDPVRLKLRNYMRDIKNTGKPIAI
jgi:hypothetical protein